MHKPNKNELYWIGTERISVKKLRVDFEVFVLLFRILMSYIKLPSFKNFPFFYKPILSAFKTIGDILVTLLYQNYKVKYLAQLLMSHGFT